jgi:hypothetical protein
MVLNSCFIIAPSRQSTILIPTSDRRCPEA